MIDKEISVEALAEMVNGQVAGDKSVLIRGFAPLENAGPEDISFMVKAKMVDQLGTTGASAVIVPMAVETTDRIPLIRVKDPYLAAAVIHNFFIEKPFVAKGIHPRAYLGEDCSYGKEISIGPLVAIGDRVTLGERVCLEAGVVVGDDVEIGNDTILKANVTIASGCTIGSRVTIHSGTVVGSDGYGYSVNERGEHIKRPQVGTVRIDDDVEIGANSCVDRATYGVTWIKSGVKIDNLVQVAHNVVVGENSLLVAQVGISGSTTLGRNVVFGGQSAAAGHLTIGDQVMVAAYGGVHNNLPKGAVVGGAPAFPIRQWAKSCAVFAKLPELRSKVNANTRIIKELNKTVDNQE